MKRPVVSEPFMSIAFDLVGTLPKGKAGKKYLLTYIALVTRWPDAISLCSNMAKQVALGMVDIFSRACAPLEMLTGQVSQFVGRLTKELCTLLGIPKLKTTPYHPQINLTLERFHGALESMVTKARNSGLN